MEILLNPLFQLVAAGVVIAVLAVFLLRKVKKRQSKRIQMDPQVESLARKGNFDAAARLELKSGNLETALEYFMQAGNPARAAQVAQRLDRPRRAAELYERAGDMERAEAMYRQAGLDRKADEIAPRKGPSLDDERPSEDGLMTPLDRARRAERTFRDAREEAQGKGPDAREQVEALGREAAEALLGAGETRRAAEVCVDAGLHDQAINLFVNLLGDPGSAAPLLAERGEHQRAAELYEAAGKKHRALAAWIDWAEDAPDPLSNISQVERLGEHTVFELLDAIVRQRPLNAGTAGLHQRIADAYAERERVDSAISLMEGVTQLAPSPEAQQRLENMRQLLARVEAKRQAEAKKPSLPPEPEDMGTQATKLSIPPEPEDLTESMFGSPAIEKLVSEVAAAAVREATNMAQRGVIGADPEATVVLPGEAPDVERAKERTSRRLRERLSNRQVGVGTVAVQLHLVNDAAVQGAVNGPSISELQGMISGREADLQNIEVFYRLGLGLAAAGRWHEAREAFEAVENASPGYRDADDRAEELTRWQENTPDMVAGRSMVNEAQSQRYKLLGELGRGGMAVVYRAQDEALDREVALKFLSEEISANPTMLKMFMREAQSAAKLNHPNIVTVYDVGTLEGKAFICMEYVTGQTVESMIDKSGRLRVLDALRVTENILEALDYAHSKHIIHRDIKPSNMMRNELGVVKLMDFGLAKSTKGEAKTTLIAGTPSYMPPEQFTGKDMDAASDLFSVGASMFEMLTGDPPFEGMARDRPPTSIREINPTVPKVLEKMVMKSLEFDKNERYSQAVQMLQPIQYILGQVTTHLQKSDD